MKELLRRITNLLAIKSLLTLALVGTFCYLICAQLDIPMELTDIVMIVVGFYFGTQTTKDK